jgi:hypothetical protein
MKTTATYDSAAGTFTLEKGIWRGTFPIADLPKWLTFYRQQQERYPTHAESYASDVKALEGLTVDLRATTGLVSAREFRLQG